MGADDCHVSVVELDLDKLERLVSSPDYKLEIIKTLAQRWFYGEISDKRMAEVVFGLTNEEVRK